MTLETAQPLAADNPFAAPSTLPYGLPDFAAIRTEHVLPAFEAGMAAERAEVEAVVTDPAPPTEDNTLLPLERAGSLLQRVSAVFFTLTGAHTSPQLDDLDEQVAPLLAAHHDAITLDRRLHDRLEALHRAVEAGEQHLAPDSAWLLHTLRQDMRRAGVAADPTTQAAVRDLNTRIATLESRFSRTLLSGTNAGAVHLTDPGDLDGLSPDVVDAAARAAAARDLDGYLLELSLPTDQPALAHLRRRDVRRRVHEASFARCTTGEWDARPVVVELARLRAERARLLGDEHHAAHVVHDSTARTATAVRDLLERLAPLAAANARDEAAELTEVLRREHPGATLEPWDWAYCSRQLRQERYALDDATLRPYLELGRVVHDGVFHAANALYGLTFTRRHDLHGYHPDVEVYEVHDTDGTGIGLFLADWYARPTKEGGAWMHNLVDQSRLLGQQAVVVNNLNVPKPSNGQPALLTWDEVITAFHEFGHALHGLLSDVRLPSQSGTEVPRDFVEFPSQVNEMWAWEPSVLGRFAVHHRTGEPMPQEWVDTLIASQRYGQGHATTEYLSAAVLDQAWHRLAPQDLPTDPGQVAAFERDALEAAGLVVHGVAPRYRSTYFKHVFGGGYAAEYYSYIWSEVLDADTVAWFGENGGLRRENGDRFRQVLLSRGGSCDVMDAFTELRGRGPDLQPLLTRRGLG